MRNLVLIEPHVCCRGSLVVVSYKLHLMALFGVETILCCVHAMKSLLQWVQMVWSLLITRVVNEFRL